MLIFLNSLPFRFATRCIYTTSYMQSKNEKQKSFQSFNNENLNLLEERVRHNFSTDQRTHTIMHISLNHHIYSQMQNAQCMYFFSFSLMLMLNKRKMLYDFWINFSNMNKQACPQSEEHLMKDLFKIQEKYRFKP